MVKFNITFPDMFNFNSSGTSKPGTSPSAHTSSNFGETTLTGDQETYKKALQQSDSDLYNKFNKIDPTLLDFLISNAQKMGLDPTLVLASVDAETGGYSAEQMKEIVSHAGAKGINQIMDITYKHVMQNLDNGTSQLPDGITKEQLASYAKDPKANLIVSMIYLRDVVIPEVKKMDGMSNIDPTNLTASQIGKILGAYNQGPYGFRESGGANNGETRAHIEKTTAFAQNLIAAA